MKKNLLIISGPSGAGKDSIIRGLKKILPLKHVITTVTRPMRAGESQGMPYYFISQKQFLKRLKQNEFFEYDKHFDHYYGLTFQELNKAQKSKKICFWQAEYRGVKTAKKQLPEITAIFIKSPLASLIKRMKQREKNITPQMLKQRVGDIKNWYKHLNIYDYVVENKEGRLDQTTKKVAKIIKDNLTAGS